MEPPSARHVASHARTGGCLSRGTITSALREALSQRQEVVAAYLFGSYATGRERPDSDVDVAVLLDTETPHCDDPLYRLDLIASLAERLHCSVDVVILNDAPLVLRHQVLTYGERILETDRAQRVAYEVRSFQLYFDFRPILDTIAEATRRHIREGTFGHQYRGHRDPLGDALRARERLEGSEEYDV